jgi:YD repeat-containing protein
LNRLTSVADSGYARSFQYDAWGNMWVSAGASAGEISGNVFNTANQISGASYDNSGNQTVVNGNSVAYDAENRQVAVTEPPALGGGTENYFYDGAGQRVEKSGRAAGRHLSTMRWGNWRLSIPRRRMPRRARRVT